jgi:hypothetical protein
MTHPAPQQGQAVNVAQKFAAQSGIAVLHRLGEQCQLELLQFRVSIAAGASDIPHSFFRAALGRGRSGLGQVTP